MTHGLDLLKTPLPKKVESHVAQALTSIVALLEISRVCREGIASAELAPQIMRVSSKVTGKPLSTIAQERAVKDAERATAELRDDYPTINSMIVVSIWSWLEHFVKHTAALWVEHDVRALSGPQFRKIKVAASELSELTQLELAYKVIEAFEQELPSNQRNGVERFERLLAPLELDIETSVELRKDILELHQIRNVVVHRNGLVDRRLVIACPWLGVAVGQRLKISSKQADAYVRATMRYGIQIAERIGEKYAIGGSKDQAPEPTARSFTRRPGSSRNLLHRRHRGRRPKGL